MKSRAGEWAAPVLVALHFPLFLFTHNVDAVTPPEILTPALTTMLVAALLVAALYIVTRDRARAVCLATGVVVWYSWYGVFSHVAATQLGVGPLAGGAVATALVPWTALWLLYAFAVARARALNVLAPSWLLVSVVLVAQPLGTVGVLLLHRPAAPPTVPAPVALRAPATPPDIFYIVFDRYGSDETLRERYGFDNSALAQALQARGFFVATNSNANYLKTGLSLAATLNHTHLDELFAGFEDVSDWRPVYNLLEEHRVWQSLKPLGYDYVHMGSWWEPTRGNRHAGYIQSYAPLPHFAQSLYLHTPMMGMGLTLGGLLDIRREQWNRIHHQLQELGDIRSRRPPLFVFVHFLLPHDPWVFGPNGEFLSLDVIKHRSLTENYVNHVRFANLAILRLADALLADYGEPKPIIILQADEGPFPARYAANERTFDWRDATREELREKFGILNAMYLPGVRPRGLHSAITPVNTFRVIFNEYFGAGLDPLPDRSFVSVGNTRPYDFIDVTDAVNGR